MRKDLKIRSRKLRQTQWCLTQGPWRRDGNPARYGGNWIDQHALLRTACMAFGLLFFATTHLLGSRPEHTENTHDMSAPCCIFSCGSHPRFGKNLPSFSTDDPRCFLCFQYEQLPHPWVNHARARYSQSVKHAQSSLLQVNLHLVGTVSAYWTRVAACMISYRVVICSNSRIYNCANSGRGICPHMRRCAARHSQLSCAVRLSCDPTPSLLRVGVQDKTVQLSMIFNWHLLSVRVFAPSVDHALQLHIVAPYLTTDCTLTVSTIQSAVVSDAFLSSPYFTVDFLCPVCRKLKLGRPRISTRLCWLHLVSRHSSRVLNPLTRHSFGILTKSSRKYFQLWIWHFEWTKLW